MKFILSDADDFEKEVGSLRGCPSFQSFLDERAKSGRSISLSDIEKEIDEELKVNSK